MRKLSTAISEASRSWRKIPRREPWLTLILPLALSACDSPQEPTALDQTERIPAYETVDAKSPLFFADQVQRPLLIGAGANDVRVLISQNDRFVAAAREVGFYVEYLVFEYEGHGCRKRANRITAVEAYVDVLERFLRAP